MSRVAIVGVGWVGKAMLKLFPEAATCDLHWGSRKDVNACDVAFICVWRIIEAMKAKICAYCGHEMQPRKREGTQLWEKRKYCSVKCSREGIKVLVPFTCEECGKEAFRKGKETKRRFCSPACMRAWRSRLWKTGAINVENHHKFERGTGNPNWKGGVTPVSEQLRRTPEYKAWRTAVFERDHYICQLCGQSGGDLNADHIKPFSTHPELRYDVDNGRTLCVPCHRKTFVFYRNQYRDGVA